MGEITVVEDFDVFNNNKIILEIINELKNIANYTPRVGILGKTGAGKSFLCNALFGKNISKVSHSEGCTRDIQEILIGDDNAVGIRLIDVPGLGESKELNEEYIGLYKKLINDPKMQLDIILWAIKSGDRAASETIEAFKNIILPSGIPVVVVVTQADTTYPPRQWNYETHTPGVDQLQNIKDSAVVISNKLGIQENLIIAVSAEEKYNLKTLLSTIVSIVPKEKKMSFTREAKKENVTKETKEEAKKSTWDYLKEKFGKAVDYVMETIDNVKDGVVDKLADKFGDAAVFVLKKIGWWPF